MRVLLIALALVGFGLAPGAAAQEVAMPDDGPVKVESYYRVHGLQKDAFVALYKKNHLPIVEAMIEEDLVQEVSFEYPLLHLPGEGAWDVRITVVWSNALAVYWQADLPQWKAAVARLFPDRAAHEAEEQERMEMLDAHWDVIVYGDE